MYASGVGRYPGVYTNGNGEHDGYDYDDLDQPGPWIDPPENGGGGGNGSGGNGGPWYPPPPPPPPNGGGPTYPPNGNGGPWPIEPPDPGNGTQPPPVRQAGGPMQVPLLLITIAVIAGFAQMQLSAAKAGRA